MADSTDAIGWSPILPSVKSVGAESNRRRWLLNVADVGWSTHLISHLVGHHFGWPTKGDQPKLINQR